MRSVTMTTRGFCTAGCSASAFASMTIVSDLPLPVVCQITPPARLPCVHVRHAVKRRLDGEILLVAGDFLDAAVVDDELIGQFQQPRRTQQGIQRPILRRRQPIPGGDPAHRNSCASDQ